MMSLLWLGIFVNTFRIFAPNIGTWVTTIFKVSNAEIITKLRQDLKTYRKEQRDISIVDEFAKHARLSRKIAALQKQLDQEVKLNIESVNSIKTRINIGFNCLLFLICAVTFFKSSEPVTHLPRQWMLPLSYFGSSWTVGFTSWTSMTYMCINQVHGAVAKLLNRRS